jgi:hypothetical protein
MPNSASPSARITLSLSLITLPLSLITLPLSLRLNELSFKAFIRATKDGFMSSVLMLIY